MKHTTARELRKHQTDSESVLWGKLRNRQFLGLKFRRQHPIEYGSSEGKCDFFVADFYCAQHKLIVELDGGIHYDRIEEDLLREDILETMGYHIIRFKNEELGNMRGVLNSLQEFIKNKTK